MGAGSELGCMAGFWRSLLHLQTTLCLASLLTVAAHPPGLACLGLFWFGFFHPVWLGAGSFLPRSWDKPGLLPTESGETHSARGEVLWDKAGSQKGSQGFHRHPCPL